jgi:hypothetical protein
MHDIVEVNIIWRGGGVRSLEICKTLQQNLCENIMKMQADFLKQFFTGFLRISGPEYVFSKTYFMLFQMKII